MRICPRDIMPVDNELQTRHKSQQRRKKNSDTEKKQYQRYSYCFNVAIFVYNDSGHDIVAVPVWKCIDGVATAIYKNCTVRIGGKWPRMSSLITTCILAVQSVTNTIQRQYGVSATLAPSANVTTVITYLLTYVQYKACRREY